MDEGTIRQRAGAVVEKIIIQFLPSPTFAAYLAMPLISEVVKELRASGFRTLVPLPKLSVLLQAYLTTLSLQGEVWEAGVYQGGTARLLGRAINDNRDETVLRLFDTFIGMPDVDPLKDMHLRGDFADTNLDAVRNFVGLEPYISFHPGFIPDTMKGLERSRIKFAHIDLDIYKSITDTLEFIYPRMSQGVLVFDDYGAATCPGALEAVDEFFAGRAETPLSLTTGQAVVFKF